MPVMNDLSGFRMGRLIDVVLILRLRHREREGEVQAMNVNASLHMSGESLTCNAPTLPA